MNFKDMKAGYPVFLYDKDGTAIANGKLTANASMPHSDPNMGWQTMVVDLTIQYGDKTTTYVVPADSNVAYPNNCVLTDSREIVVREIEMELGNADQALAQMPRHQEKKERCTQLLADFNPAIKEKQETEARFAAMEEKMAGVDSKMQGIVGKMDKMCEMMQKFIN